MVAAHLQTGAEVVGTLASVKCQSLRSKKLSQMHSSPRVKYPPRNLISSGGTLLGSSV